MEWVGGIESLRDNDTCGVVGLRLGYEELGYLPNVLLAARATTSCLLYQIAAPSAAAFLLPWRINDSVEQLLQHNEEYDSRRFINSNDLDALV